MEINNSKELEEKIKCLDKMTDEEIIEFANDVAGMIELLGKKYKK